MARHSPVCCSPRRRRLEHLHAISVYIANVAYHFQGASASTLDTCIVFDLWLATRVIVTTPKRNTVDRDRIQSRQGDSRRQFAGLIQMILLEARYHGSALQKCNGSGSETGSGMRKRCEV
ncbi:hypothetical protein Cob_v007733 [Colletotrichum orbiculare MAFF 240422]|uniref:Uncharacterized protein n=1 Tax=Colletotrichum orbiculare (strain 104-T / ATCC 96160 / CBS 514.97 / LARS 414 / MAFF 240422) TaxID=1213857 RepID=A0A484FNP6_COLOR|nr:hypothetical protein Cob_v007733 [Colletotrichum orbiculare MAFF 240422]